MKLVYFTTCVATSCSTRMHPSFSKSADFCDDVFFGMLKIRAESRAQTFGIVARKFQFLFFDSCALTFRLLLELHQNDSDKFDFIFIRGANPVQ